MTTIQKALEETRHDLLWQAVQQRDPTYDGSVIYAVRTTGIYCRPTCPSRRPYRANVRFFADSKEAESAGYRACRRCLPDRPDQKSRNSDLVKLICHQIDSHLDQHPDGLPSLAQLSQAVDVSASHLQRVFKKETGLTPRQYAHTGRLERFKSLVRDGSAVTTALFDSGFSSSSRLYEDADGQFGMTPGRYRSGGAGTTIGYLVAESPLGSLLVAATGKGICSVKLGDDASTLLKDLQAEFPAADFQEGDETLRGWLESVLEYLEGERLGLDLPSTYRPRPFSAESGVCCSQSPTARPDPTSRWPSTYRPNRQCRPSRRQRLRLESRGAWSSPVIVRCERTALSEATGGASIVKRPFLRWKIVRVPKTPSERALPVDFLIRLVGSLWCWGLGHSHLTQPQRHNHRQKRHHRHPDAHNRPRRLSQRSPKLRHSHPDHQQRSRYTQASPGHRPQYQPLISHHHALLLALQPQFRQLPLQPPKVCSPVQCGQQKQRHQ